MPFEHDTIIYDDELRSVVMEYSECGAPMRGTGKMQYNATLKRWFVEFWCPEDEDYMSMSTVETNIVAERVAKRHARARGIS